MRSLIETGFTCPKSMTFGPCGGVEFDGSCEVAEHRCVFVDESVPRWGGIAGSAAADEFASVGSVLFQALMNERQVVIGDFPARALDAASLAECAEVMAGAVDATLAGDSGQHRVQFSPSYRAALIQSHGLPVFSGLNCRDRNRVALEGEVAGLVASGVAGVHCVTGDHTLTGSRPDALPVFDLDSTQLAALAAAAGLLVSVGEAPATPPVDRRAMRLVEKQKAGAQMAFVNHAGGVDPVARFTAEASERGRAEGLSPLAFIACVPVVLDRGSAELLASFTTLALPAGFLERILGARDVYAEGISAAIDLSNELLSLEHVDGVNLSGGPEDGRETYFAEALAEISSGVSLRRH